MKIPLTPEQAAEQIVPPVDTDYILVGDKYLYVFSSGLYESVDDAESFRTAELARVAGIVREAVEGATAAWRQGQDSALARLDAVTQQLADLTRRHEQVCEAAKFEDNRYFEDEYGLSGKWVAVPYDEFNALRNALTPPAPAKAAPQPADLQTCGHPLTAIASSDEGTHYCQMCAEEADKRPPRPTHPSGMTPVWKVPEATDQDRCSVFGQWQGEPLPPQAIAEYATRTDPHGFNWHRWCIPSDESAHAASMPRLTLIEDGKR